MLAAPQHTRRRGREVEGGSLENCWAARSRGFESYRLRHVDTGPQQWGPFLSRPIAGIRTREGRTAQRAVLAQGAQRARRIWFKPRSDERGFFARGDLTLRARLAAPKALARAWPVPEYGRCAQSGPCASARRTLAVSPWATCGKGVRHLQGTPRSNHALGLSHLSCIRTPVLLHGGLLADCVGHSLGYVLRLRAPHRPAPCPIEACYEASETR